MSRPTRDLAEVIIDQGRTLDRPRLVQHVLEALQRAYDDGKREGFPEARSRAIREQLAICRGLEQDARARVLQLEAELANGGKGT